MAGSSTTATRSSQKACACCSSRIGSGRRSAARGRPTSSASTPGTPSTRSSNRSSPERLANKPAGPPRRLVGYWAGYAGLDAGPQAGRKGARESARLLRRGDPDAGPGHRGDDGGVQRGERGRVAAPALPGIRAARAPGGGRRSRSACRDVLPKLRAVAIREPVLGGDGRALPEHRMVARDGGRRRRAGDAPGRVHVGRVVSAAGNGTCAGAHVYRRRGSAPRARGRVEPRLVAGRLRSEERRVGK